jgi:hypothetical protein
MLGSAEGRTCPVRLVSDRETELYIVENFRSFNELHLYLCTAPVERCEKQDEGLEATGLNDIH